MLDIQSDSSLSSTIELNDLLDRSFVMHSRDKMQAMFDEYSGYIDDKFINKNYLIYKRIFDIIISLLGIMVFSPILPIVALCIFCNDRGPIFYRHIRVGQYGKPFLMYKFRSMVTDADDYFVRHPEVRDAWQKSGKLAEDPRITRVGHFLRRTSIDELPQLFNVLRGDLSLIGPRAIQFSEVARFGKLAELRHKVKPGVTGLWQVSGRSITNYKQRAVMDCFYVMNCSLRTDMLIFLKTIPAVIRGDGAY